MAKEKKKKKVLTKEQKLVKKRKRLTIAASIFAVIILFIGIVATVSLFGSKALLENVQSIKPVEYKNAVIRPKDIDLDENGKLKFDSENDCFNIIDHDGLLDSRNFKVLQLTDIHIGAGAFSMRTDAWTVQTVQDLVKSEQPDLVIVTGDIAYPVPFQAGTLNNLREAEVFATMMENLGVYWTLGFGNHDTEAYSTYTREDIGSFYANDARWKHCIFTDRKAKTSDGKEVFGVGNFPINIRNKNNEIIHTIFMIDSNAYVDSDPFGMAWDYDNIHDDQIKWYKESCLKQGIVVNNGNEIEVKSPSTMYFHIPIVEYRTVYEAHSKDGNNKTITHCDGWIGEHSAGALGTSYKNDIYNAMLEYGTRGTFTGHDHYNNASYIYDINTTDDKPGIKFTYGMSIDYLAYPGIYKKTAQRGARVIEINKLGSELLATGTVAPIGDKINFSEEQLNKIKADNRDYFGWNTRLAPYKYDLYRDETIA